MQGQINCRGRESYKLGHQPLGGTSLQGAKGDMNKGALDLIKFTGISRCWDTETTGVTQILNLARIACKPHDPYSKRIFVSMLDFLRSSMWVQKDRTLV